MSITDLGVFEIVLISLVYLVIAIFLIYISGNDYPDEKVPWWRSWNRWK